MIEQLGGRQYYIFYTMSSNQAHRVGMIEVLIDEELADEEQLVIDRGELNVPSNEEAAAQNFGPITLGGGDIYLLANFDYFDRVKGYTMCAYNQRVSEVGATTCESLSPGQFTLTPFTMKAYTCESPTFNDNEKAKLEFLCRDQPQQSDVFMVVVLSTLFIGITFCCVSFCIFVRLRAHRSIGVDEVGAVADVEQRRHDPAAAQRIQEMQNRQRLTMLSKVLLKKKFAHTKFKEN